MLASYLIQRLIQDVRDHLESRIFDRETELRDANDT